MKNQRKTIQLSVIMMLISTFSIAQTISPRDRIYNALGMNQKLYESEDYKGRSFVFAVWLSVDSKGMVDDVIFSDNSILYLGLLIDFKAMKRKLLGTEIIAHKNEMLTQLFTLNRGDQDLISNGDELIKCWAGIDRTSSILSENKRTQVFLRPITIVGPGKKNIN